jgi:hypothetical protein
MTYLDNRAPTGALYDAQLHRPSTLVALFVSGPGQVCAIVALAARPKSPPVQNCVMRPRSRRYQE